MCSTLARERGDMKKKPQNPNPLRKLLFFFFSPPLASCEAPGKLLGRLLSPCKRPRSSASLSRPVRGQDRLSPGSPADPRGGLLTLSPGHCAAHRSRPCGLMPADTDTMATRMGCEGISAGAAPRLHAGLTPGSWGAQAVAVTAASRAHVWAATLLPACIKTGCKNGDGEKRRSVLQQVERNGR